MRLAAWCQADRLLHQADRLVEAGSCLHFLPSLVTPNALELALARLGTQKLGILALKHVSILLETPWVIALHQNIIGSP